MHLRVSEQRSVQNAVFFSAVVSGLTMMTVVKVLFQRIHSEITCNLCVSHGLEKFGDFFFKVTSWR